MYELNEATLKERFSIFEIMFYVYKADTHYNNFCYFTEYGKLYNKNDEIHEKFAEKGQ